MNDSLVPETKPPRQSNVELFRIVATFFILVVHANFQTFGAPTQTEVNVVPFTSFLRFLLEAFAVVGVDSFVLISGWFGIRPSRKSLVTLGSQFFFFTAGIYAVALWCGTATLDKEMVLNLFCLSHWNWFLRAYLGLVVLAPVLNAYCERTPENCFRFQVFAFFCLQTVWGWIARDTQSFRGGQSTISFVGLYLLARYVSIHRPDWSCRSFRSDFSKYFLLVLVIAVSGTAAVRTGWNGGVATVYSNASPLVILASVFLLLCFSKVRFHNAFVNRVAKSSYASYLFHTHPVVLVPFYCQTVNMLVSQRCGIVLAAGFVAGVYAVSVLLDQVRVFVCGFVFSRGFFCRSERNRTGENEAHSS